MKKYNIAVVGATGLVGNKILEILEERNFPIQNLHLFASSKSSGKKIVFMGKEYVVETLCSENILNKKIDFALFSAGGSRSLEFAEQFNKIGARVIDNSSAFRMKKEIPLIVPEVNAQILKRKHKIIANPNCSTIQCMPPLKALHDFYHLKSISYTSFQAVSGSGVKGIKDLENSLSGNPNEFYPYPIANNCLPHIGNFKENGFSEEELKMVNETKKILGLKNIKVSATCVRVPVLNSHTVSISATFSKEVDISVCRILLKNFKNIIILDEPEKNIYPLASLASGRDEVFVGRIRKDLFNPKTIHFITVADNIRKGAATNAVQILEYLVEKK